MNPTLKAEAEGFMLSHEPEPEHVRQVARLALELFDQSTDLHGLGQTERDWLEAAALLHDVGWSVVPDGTGHHKESAKLIAGFKWTELDSREIAIIAQTARYHRKSLPSEDHPDFMALAEMNRQIVSKLAALLRIADGLDRQHLSKVSSVQVRKANDVVTVLAKASSDLAEELSAATKKADLAERVFAKRFVFAAA